MVLSFKNYNHIKIPHNPSGIFRKNLPQIDSNHIREFEKFLSQHDVHLSIQKLKLKDLKFIQKDFNEDKIKSMISSADKNQSALKKPILVSNSNHVIDGNHRVIALMNINPNDDIIVHKANVSTEKLLQLAHDFPKSYTKKLHEQHVPSYN